MKTISGKVTSTNPISLSKAAKVLSNFVTADNGASQPVSVYLRRASAAFKELVQFHKELKSSKSESNQKRHVEESINSKGMVEYEQNHEKYVAVQEDSATQRHKKKNKQIEGAERGEISLAKKKRKNEELYDGELVGSAEQGGAKKKKSKIENKQ